MIPIRQLTGALRWTMNKYYNVGAGCPALVRHKMTINIFVDRLNVS